VEATLNWYWLVDEFFTTLVETVVIIWIFQRF
jgi:hypothetical protein